MAKDQRMTTRREKVSIGTGRRVLKRDRLTLAIVVLAVIAAQFVGVTFLIARQVHQRTGVITKINHSSKLFSLAVEGKDTTLQIAYDEVSPGLMPEGMHEGAYVKVVYRGAWGKWHAVKIERVTETNPGEMFERFSLLGLCADRNETLHPSSAEKLCNVA